MKIETERLILRKPKKDDWKEIYKNSDFKVIKNFVRVSYPFNKKDAKKIIKNALKGWGKEGYRFIIELKSNKGFIGMISLNKTDKIDKTAETSSWISIKNQNKGYISEAKIAINDFAFNKLKLRRLETQVIKENKISNYVQAKMGYKFEGTKRKSRFSTVTKKVVDMNMYGLLKEDWKKIAPKLKRKLKEKIKKLK
jgi:ribosomal-protein-alanine N-acetyltransferase